jgi:hypothetical protein
MKERVINLRGELPLMDIRSLGRGFQPLTRAQRALVLRTVRRVPEVMVKVSGGSRTAGGVAQQPMRPSEPSVATAGFANPTGSFARPSAGNPPT